MKAKIVFSIATAMSLLGAYTSHATLFAYDGFNYGTGSLTNASGLAYVDNVNSGGDSFGFAGRFTETQANGNATNIAAGLNYTDAAGNILQTDGGSALIGNPANNNGANTIVNRTFQIGSVVSGTGSGTVYSGLSSGTYWISYISYFAGAQNPPGSLSLYSRLGSVAFSKAATAGGNGVNPQISVGRPNTNSVTPLLTPTDTWSMWSSNGPIAAFTSTVSVTNATFVLMELVVDGTTANDQVYTWLNWSNLTVTPDIAAANLTTNVNLTGLNEVRLEADGSTTLTPTVLAIDELRLGDSFSSVAPLFIPEPTSMALAILGGTGMFALIRRRKNF